MKLSVNIKRLLLIILVLASHFSMHVNAQCVDFAQDFCKEKLGKFIHDGNYNAIPLGDGESAELYKTFFSNSKYRLAVCQQNKNQKDIQIQIVDEENHILFDNELHELTDTWDFSVESTQMLIVKLTVLKSQQSNNNTDSCIALLFGIH